MFDMKIREEWYNLLLSLKTTVEGLLCMPCSDVWSVYGGLQRVTKNVHDILSHQLNFEATQSIYDRTGQLWKVIRGLKYLDPVLSPSIDKIARDTSIEDEAIAWVQQSLLSFTMASQLNTLISNKAYLHQFYHDSAFILQTEYTCALITCLHAIEYNRAALLADINPFLLSKRSLEEPEEKEAGPASPIKGPLSPVTSPTRKSPLRHQSPFKTHIRSASLPEDWFSELFKEEEMGRRSTAYDRLAPPLLIPTRATTSDQRDMLNDEYAKPDSYGSSSDESARDALIQVLHNSGQSLDDLLSHDNNKSSENNKDFLGNVTMLPNSEIALPTKYNANITHLSAFNHKSPVLRLKRRKNRESERSSVITKAVSAEVLNKILNEDCAEGDNTNDKSREESTSCDMTNSELQFNELQSTSEQTEKPEANMPQVPSYSVERITTQAEISVPTSPLPTSPTLESPDSGYSTLKKSTLSTQERDVVTDNMQNNDKVNRKSSHYRSMSDYGVTSGLSHVTNPTSNQNNSNRSSSVSDLQVQDRSAPSVSPLSSSAASTSFFHQPQQGESLIGFLSSQDFHTAAELDKENAHFSICETLIAAIEQMKFAQVLNPGPADDDIIEGDSDEEIQELKQRIRIRRRERMREKARGFPAFPEGRTETMTTSSQSQEPEYDSFEGSISSQGSESSSEEVHDTELNDADTSTTSETNLQSLRASGLSLSMASLYSDAELQRSNARADQREQLQAKSSVQQRNDDRQNSNSYKQGNSTFHHSSNNTSILPDGTLVFSQNAQMSAESVAISLLKRFSEKQLPKASDLEWLVSEQDAPQQLLPLPDSYPVSPDDNENADLLTSGKRTRLRGNLEWAPPRAQIIFNVHPTPTRKILLASQNYRCAGCGTKVEPAYMKRYRYCEYLGKYFCPCCHSNEMAYIPGRVVRKWDLNKYYVSNFARDLLSKIENEPLFSIEDLNPSLYKKVRALEQIRDYRKQLTHLVAFLKTCRKGTQLLHIIEGEPAHWTVDPHLYTLRELVNVRKGLLMPRIRALINEALNHVQQCQLCQAKGFICEMCNDSEVIFPFELERVVQCDLCRACFHKDCYIPQKCPKCSRIELRRMRMNEEMAAEEE